MEWLSLEAVSTAELSGPQHSLYILSSTIHDFDLFLNHPLGSSSPVINDKGDSSLSPLPHSQTRQFMLPSSLPTPR